MPAPPKLMYIDSRPGALSEPLTGRRWDAATALSQARRRAVWFAAAGLRPGDRAFLLSGNCLELFADLLAVWSLGACAIPVDTRLTSFEIATLAAAARPRIAVGCDPPAADAAGALAATDTSVLVGDPPAQAASDGGRAPSVTVPFDADALVLFTSGTTGQPKGVVHTHRSLRARWLALRQTLGVEAFRRTLCLLPTHFGHGLICNSLYPWLAGCDLHILPPFRPDLAMQLGDLIDEHEISFLSSVPPMWHLALKASRPPRKGSLRRVFCGSAPFSAHLWGRVRAWAGPAEVWNAYGITETGSWVAGTAGDDTPEDGLIGAGWGSVVKVLKSNTTDVPPGRAEACAPGESGYVWLNTAALMKGYLDRDDLTARVVHDGWFVTGDIGAVDDRGRLFLHGREREEINKGGMKIYPGDIDAVAEGFVEATDVCAFPCAHPTYGQDVAMAVVLKDASDPTLRALHAWMRQRLAEHQMPQRWYVLPDIPRTSRGKLNRTEVAAACAALTPVDLHRALGAS